MSFTEERALWLYEHFLWLERTLPAKGGDFTHRMILPTKEFFPDRFHQDHQSAVVVFDRVKALMGIQEWRCSLEPQVPGNREVNDRLASSGVLGSQSSNDAAGTFSIPEDGVVITYAPHLLKNPVALVATMAHELCHYLLATVKEEPPATWSELEPLTDLCAVAEGFGVFLANSAFQFSQWSSSDQHGWGFERLGYLSEEELGFATAVFCVRNGIDAGIAARTLKPNPREVYCDALDFVVELEER